MYLTNAEHEAFIRGQAAGLIPLDLPLPTNHEEISKLIFHIGIMESAKIGYRDANGKLRVKAITTFTEEHLNNLAAGAKFRRDFYPNMLEALYNYFAFGPQIIAIKDLTGRLSLQKEKLTVAQIQKGFELKYRPIERPATATPKQRTVLAKMILSNRLPTLTQRQWENLTKPQASQLISSVPKSCSTQPNPVNNLLTAFEELTSNEKTLLHTIINRRSWPLEKQKIS